MIDPIVTAGAEQPEDSDPYLGLVLETTGDALWEYVPANREICLHPSFGLQQGLSAKRITLTLDNFLEQVHLDDRGALISALDENKPHSEWRMRLRHADSGWRWYRIRARLRGQRLVALQSEITSELEREAAMADTLSRYLALYDKAPLGLLVWNREGRIVDWNRQAETIFGYTRSEIQGRRFISLLFPTAIQDDVVSIARGLFQQGGNHQGDFSNLRAGGHTLHCHWNSVALRNSRGTVTGVLSLVSDETAGWISDQERQHNEARNRALIETSPDAILVLDMDGRIRSANQKALDLAGVDDRADVIGRNAIEWVIDADRERFLTEVMARPEDYLGFVGNGEYRITDANGTEHILDLHHTTLTLSDGSLDGIVFFMRDITQARRDELELIAHRDHLEALVGERTAALEDARQLAENSAKAKGEFLANMSHEIRTPMNAVIGLTRLALRTELDYRQRDYLERISGAGKLLLGLINDVLDLSKIEANRIELENAPFVLDEVLDTVATLVGGRAQEKGLEFHYLLDGDVPHRLIGDSLRLTQVLVNLCSNALKFTASGHVVVRVRTCSLTETTGRLAFYVEDTGVGLTADQTARLFTAFQQAEASTTRRYGGTGLGLVIAKRLVQLMGGEIGLDSTPGQGTTFFFEATVGIESGNAVAWSTPKELIGQTVRVIDDHPLAGEAIASALQRMGLRTEVHTEIALDDSHDNAHTAVILLDSELPGAEAYVRRLIAEDGQIGPRPRIVLLAGSDIEASTNAVNVWGADDCLTKPVTVVRLLRALSGERRSLPELRSERFEELRGQRLLIVDDVPVNRLILSEMLSDWGVIADQAESAEQALGLALSRGGYAAILMDVQMPEVDGLEATRRLRAHQFTAPVIAVTAHSLDAEREHCLAAGMDDIITKPIDPDRLAQILCRLLPAGTGSPVPPAPIPEPAACAVPQPLTLTDDAPVPDLTVLPGIDTEIGLRRMQGKPRLYQKVLHDFLQRFEQADSQIATALSEGRRDDALSAAHSLKGLAATIGAEALSECTAFLEKTIVREGDTDWPLAALTLELAQVVGGLRAVFTEN